jgi:uncharacterized membrane protein YgcG
MKNLMRAGVCLLLAFILLGYLTAFAQDVPAVRDSAAVLGAATLKDARALVSLTEESIGITLTVETRHFLGGAEVNAYAQRLLDETSDPSNTLLLLMVIGEENYALAAGSGASRLLNAAARETLLSTQFRSPFLARDYDRAVSAFLSRAADQLADATGKTINQEGLFGQVKAPTPAPTAAPQSTGPYKRVSIFDLNSILGEQLTPTSVPQSGNQNEDKDKGLSLGSIVFIGIVLSMFFGRKNRGGGCGCGPLGWIAGVFGASKIFGWRR